MAATATPRLTAAALALALLAGCAPQAVKPPPPAAPAQDQAPLRQLKQASALIQARQPEAALVHIDQAIALYEARYAGDTRHFYCARGRDESILYAANAAAVRDPASVLVLPPYWADAYFMKGYALHALGRYEEAEPWLQKAVALSPANAQYLAELGYNQQKRGQWAQSLELYRKAEVASALSPAPQRQRELARALRGQAHALAEEGRLDQSEQLYQRCLELDANDAAARRELQRIRQRRARSGAA